MEQQARAKIITSVVVLVMVIAMTVTGVIVLTTSPQEIGPSGVTAVFISLLLLFTGIFGLFEYRLKVRRQEYQQKRLSTLARSLRTGFIFSLAIVVVLALRSLRNLNARDVVLFALVLLVIEVYFRTRRD